ncbi:unnamed protein product, partial [Effrenium voratum]
DPIVCIWLLQVRMEAGRVRQSLALLLPALVFVYYEPLIDLVRQLFRCDGRAPRASALRSGRRLKVAILGAGMGGSALALWLRDIFGDQVDIAVISNGPVGGRCQTLEFEGCHYEAGASIISEVNILFKALMARFSLKKMELSCNRPLAVYNGTRFLFSTASNAATSGWRWAAEILTTWKLSWRFGFLSLLRLKRLSKCSCAPNFTRLYAALRDGATYVHPRELLSTLGHGCLCLTERKADQWLVREMGLPGAVVRELAEPGMRCNYGGQSCGALHALVGLVSIVGGISSKCFAVVGGNSQVAESCLAQAKPRMIRGLARVVRRANAGTLYEPGYEIGYHVMPEDADRVCSAAAASRGGRVPDTDGLFMEAFHVVVVAHPLEHSRLIFEDCCQGVQANATPEFRRCTAHFLRGTLNLRHFAEAPIRQASPSELRSASGAYEDDPQQSMPLFAPAQILTTNDATTPFYSIGLQLPVDTSSMEKAEEIVASAENGEPQVYKVFAPHPLPEAELDKWFNRSEGSSIHVVDWYAYPQYEVPQSFRPFVLDQGVYYINAVEQVASAMEMSLVGARNVANLIAEW